MRKLFRLIVLVFLPAVLFYQGLSILFEAGGSIPENVQDRLARSITGFVFKLEKDRWMTFALPASGTLRLITNAAAPHGVEPPPGEPFRYAIAYRLLDADGKLIEGKDYHQGATLTRYRDPGSDKTYLSSIFLDEPLVPLDGKIILIDLKGEIARAKKLQIRTASLPAPLEGIFVRVYRSEVLPVYKLKALWQRKRLDTRERLARGNVYPVDLLTQQERLNLMRRQWDVLAPQGVPGKDFYRSNIYILKEITGKPVYHFEEQYGLLPAGLYVPAGQLGIIPLPQGGGRFRFRLLPLERGKEGEQAELTWYGTRMGQQEKLTPVSPGKKSEAVLDTKLEEGMVVVSAPARLVVRAYRIIKTNGEVEEEEITPDEMSVGAYVLETGDTLEYRIFHHERRKTPFRIDLRSMEGGTGVNVQYRFADKTGTMTASAPLSQLDYLTVQEMRVSEKMSFHFRISPGVQLVRLVNNGPRVLVTAYDRPPGLVKKTRVPEDYLDYDPERKREPGWFFRKSTAHDELAVGERLVWVRVQPRPPEVDEDILSGNYGWEQFYPLGGGRVRRLLLPVDADVGIGLRRQAVPHNFTGVPRDRDFTVEVFHGEGGIIAARSRLFFADAWETEGDNRVKLFLDGELYWQSLLTVPRGEMFIPQLGQGRHVLRFESSAPVKLYLNNLEPGELPLWREVRAAVMDDGLSFVYRKEREEEMLSFRLFAPYGVTGRVRLHVELNNLRRRGDGPLVGWTFGRRVFDVEAAEGRKVFVLGSPLESVGEGRVIFFPVGGDVVAGEYRLGFRLEGMESSGYYLQVYRVTPGQVEEVRFYVERSKDETQ